MAYIRPEEVLPWMLIDIEDQEPGKTIAEMITIMQTGLPHTCPKCAGKGRFNFGDYKVVCDVCGGFGKTATEVEEVCTPVYTPTIPPPLTLAWRGIDPVCLTITAAYSVTNLLESGNHTITRSFDDSTTSINYYVLGSETYGPFTANFTATELVSDEVTGTGEMLLVSGIDLTGSVGTVPHNTGMQEFSTLEQYYIETDEATGATKANAPEDEDYIEPVENLVACPLP